MERAVSKLQLSAGRRCLSADYQIPGNRTRPRQLGMPYFANAGEPPPTIIKQMIPLMRGWAGTTYFYADF